MGWPEVRSRCGYVVGLSVIVDADRALPLQPNVPPVERVDGRRVGATVVVYMQAARTLWAGSRKGEPARPALTSFGHVDRSVLEEAVVALGGVGAREGERHIAWHVAPLMDPPDVLFVHERRRWAQRAVKQLEHLAAEVVVAVLGITAQVGGIPIGHTACAVAAVHRPVTG